MSQVKVYRFSFKSMTIKSLKVWVCVYVCMCTQLFTHVKLFTTPWIVAHQTPLCMGLPRQEYWSELPFPPQGICPTQRLNSISCVSCIGRWILYHCATWEYPIYVCSCIFMLIVIWQKPTQHCKASILLFSKKSVNVIFLGMFAWGIPLRFEWHLNFWIYACEESFWANSTTSLALF